MKTSLIIAAAGLMAAASPASAATYFFSFTGSDSSAAADGNVLSFIGSTGSPNGSPVTNSACSAAAICVRATGWSDNGSILQDSKLNTYSGGGMGVTSGDDDGSSPSHTIDNQERRDFVVLQFNQLVSITSAGFNVYNASNGNGCSSSSATTNCDGDARLGYSTGGSFLTAPALNNAASSVLTPYLTNGYESAGNGGAPVNRPINGGVASAYGNVWVIAAGSGTAFAAGNDDFKLTGLTVVTQSAVPEPATWAMMIAGFGAVGGAMRRRRQDAKAAIA